MQLSIPRRWVVLLAFVSLFSFPGLAQTPILGPAATINYGSYNGGSGPPYFFGANNIAISGNYIYIPAYSENALQIMDISDPMHPVPAGNLLNGQGGAEINSPIGICVSGGYAYITNGSGGGSLEIVDVSNPLAPVHKGMIANGTGGAGLGYPTSVVVDGNFAYVVGSNGDLEIVDVSDATSPVHRSKFQSFTNLNDIVVVGNYAYISAATSFLVVDITDVDAPALVGSRADGSGASLQGANGHAIVGNYAYVPTYVSGALEILDISNPASPLHKGRLFNGGGAILQAAENVVIDGDYAFVSSRGSSAIEVVNISDPASPTHVTNIGRNNAYATVVSGNYLFSVGDTQLKVFSIYTPIPTTVLAPTAMSPTGFTANWSAVPTADHYLLDVSNDNFATFLPGFNAANQTGTAAPVAGLQPGTTYQVRVRSANANGEAPNSSIYNVVILPEVAVATSATGITMTSFTANWNPSGGATSYAIDVSRFSDFVSFEFNNINVGNVTSHVFDVSLFTPGQEFYYRVRAVSAGGASASSNPVQVKTQLLAPFAQTATNYSIGTFTANWAIDYAVVNYHFDLATDEDFTSMVPGFEDLIIPTNYSYHIVEGLEPNTVYYYRLRAGNEFSVSANSNVVSALTPPIAPTLLAPSPVSQTSITLNWSVEGSSYILDVSGDDFDFETFMPGFEGKIVNTNSAVIPSLEPGIIVYYRVKAVNTTATSNPTFGHAITIPAAPVINPPALLMQNALSLVWESVVGSTQILMDVSTDVNFTSFLPGKHDFVVTTYPVQITGLPDNTQYFYRVRAGNESGLSPYSNVMMIHTSPLQTTVSAATAITQTSFVANWVAVAGVDEYGLDVSTDNFSNFVDGFEKKRVTGTSAIVSPVSAGTTYYYRIRTANASGFSLPSFGNFVVTVPGTPIPAAATNITQTSFTANWEAAPGATSYFVDVKNKDGAKLQAYNNKSVNQTSLAVSLDVAAGEEYTYVVRATSTVGTSPDSQAQQVLTIPATPVGGPVGADAIPTPTGFVARWNKVTGATSYKLTVSSSLNFTGNIIAGYDAKDVGDVGSSSVSVNSPNTGATYYFRVTAINGSGESPPSVPVAVTTPNSELGEFSFPAGGGLADYRIISIPVGATASATLTADSYETSWRIMHYNPTIDDNEDVRTVSSIQAGKGYWINSNLNPAPTIKLGGSHFPQIVTLTLAPGWNQIGNPLNRSISWADVKVKNGGVAGNVGDLYIYEGAFDTSTGLPVFGGGFVNNISTSSVDLIIPIDVASGGRTKKAPPAIDSRDLNSDTWLLPLEISSDGRVNSLGGIGMHPKAEESIDYFDAIALPRFFDMPELISPHPEFFQPRFMRDIFPSKEEMTWTFSTGGGEGSATLRWDNEAWKDGEAVLLLFDVSKQALIDMKMVNEYSFNISAGGKFKIFYGARGRVSPDITGMGDPYPNPSASAVTMPFVSAGEETVRVQIYDLSGRALRTMTMNEVPKGFHSLNWDGHDDQGAKVPAGMYVYRFTSMQGVPKVGKIVMQ